MFFRRNVPRPPFRPSSKKQCSYKMAAVLSEGLDESLEEDARRSGVASETEPFGKLTTRETGTDAAPLVNKLVGVFWDIENCSVPNGKSALQVFTKHTAILKLNLRINDSLNYCYNHMITIDLSFPSFIEPQKYSIPTYIYMYSTEDCCS